jgi:hypothetical protein
MKLCGWKTRAMFDRHNIIDEAELARAVGKRFNGKQEANITTPTTQPDSVSSCLLTRPGSSVGRAAD